MGNVKDLDKVLEKALDEVNEYCKSIKSKVVFLGHVESPELCIYPHISVFDPLDVGVNISSMKKSKAKILSILESNDIYGEFGRDIEGNVEFTGVFKKGGVQG